MQSKKDLLTRRSFLKLLGGTAAGFSLGQLGFGHKAISAFAQESGGLQAPADFDLIYPNSVDPVLSATMGREVRVPFTCPALNGEAMLHATDLKVTLLTEAESLTGHRITSVRDPQQDLELVLSQMSFAANNNDVRAMQEAAQEAIDILTGNTQGRVYDGFSLLNFNRGAYVDDHIEGEYKMKRLVDTGETYISEIDGQEHKIWEVTINMLWYGHNFDSDTFLLRIPFEAHEFDTWRVKWRIYSLVQEDLAPSTIMNDGFGRIFHGLDSTFVSIPAGTLGEISVNYPTLRHTRGMYIWGWGVHPPRVQFLQPVVEINENGDLNPAGLSFSQRTRTNLTLDNISDVAPEKKAYNVAQLALDTFAAAEAPAIAAMLNDAGTNPRGTFRDWARLMADQRQLPPEAWDVLAEEDGLRPRDFGNYDIVIAYMNNEIYGDNPYAQFGAEGKRGVVKDWAQGDIMRVKIINFDHHVHYYRNVDFGARLIYENVEAFGNGAFSFEKFSPKPSYGVPKVAEMQWRTGWGYVPHVGIAGQSGLFPRVSDQAHLVPFIDQLGQTHFGYIFQNASGYWRFNPPAAIREGDTIPAGNPLREVDGGDGVLISYDAEAFGSAKMPTEAITTHPDRDAFPELNFPGFLRNPTNGGDIIPPTPTWAPFLTLNPETGSLLDPEGNYWVDSTYFHGRPVHPGRSIVANVEAPRAGAQLFYQFDPLFHDNMIFSLHPRSDSFR